MNYETVQKWFSHDGDNTHRMNYDLNENSVVLDLGGFHGEWANKIWHKYNCFIYVFEPIPNLYEYINERFKDNEKIKVFNFGISDVDKTIGITLNNDGSSFYLEGQDKVECSVKSVYKFFVENNIKKVDLMKINIEGDEYPVMKSLLDTGLIDRIDNIQVQFHDFIPNCVELRKSIHERISKTHELTYNYEFVWENWKKII